MRVHCAPACFACEDLAAPEIHDTAVAVQSSSDGTSTGTSHLQELLDRGGDFGVLQNFVSSTKDIRESILQTRDYLKRARRVSTLGQDIVDICRNQRAECTFWAMKGECEQEDPTYIKRACAATCQSCHTLSKPPKLSDAGKLIQAWPLTDLERGADMGVPQILHPDRPEDTLVVLLNARMHIRYTIFDQTILEGCQNEYDSCTMEAINGECETNPKWMHIHCAPACKTCQATAEFHRANAELQERCGISDLDAPSMAWRPGDLNAMFERLIHEPFASQYNVQILSSPSTTPEGAPYVIQLEDVISEEEASGLIAAANKDGYDGDRLFHAKFRTAKIATCQDECYRDEVVQRVSERIHSLTGFHDSNCEYLHLPRYESDHYFALHSDYTPEERYIKQGVRLLTLYVYLNDVEPGGGETHFEHLNITVLPKRGRALVWPSVLNENPHEKDERMLHEGLPPNDGGVKYGMAAWYHMNDYKAAERLGCALE